MPLLNSIRLGRGSGVMDDVAISSTMAANLTDWLNAFYGVADWQASGVYNSRLPSTLTGRIATLATNELEITAADNPRGRAVREAFGRFSPNLKTALQHAAAAGMCALRPYVDNGKILVQMFPAGKFYPTEIGPDGSLRGCFFLDFRDSAAETVTRVERYQMQADGTITVTNTAYRYSGGVLGAPVPLSSVPRWAGLTPEATIRDVDRLPVAIVRMPFANTVDDTSPMPISFYAEALDSIREFDGVYREFLYELHSGKRRSIVDYSALLPEHTPTDKTLRSGRGSPLSGVTDTYVLIDGAGQLDGKTRPFDDYSPAIRVEEYKQALTLLLRDIERKTGFSPGTFSVDDRTGGVTAREIISQDMETYQTVKDIQEKALRPALTDLFYAIDVLARANNLATGGAPEPAITFGDSVFEDTESEFTRRLLLVQQGVLKPELLLKWYFGVSEEQAAGMIPDQTPTIDLFGGA